MESSRLPKEPLKEIWSPKFSTYILDLIINRMKCTFVLTVMKLLKFKKFKIPIIITSKDHKNERKDAEASRKLNLSSDD